MVKLNKILFFSDFDSMLHHHRPITGAVYQRLKHGPCPQQMRPALDRLIADGAISIMVEDTYGLQQQRVVPHREANLDLFSATEIDTTDQILQRVSKMSNSDIEHLSHQTVAWRIADVHQEIPYETAFCRPPSYLSEDDLVWAKSMGERRNAGVEDY